MQQSIFQTIFDEFMKKTVRVKAENGSRYFAIDHISAITVDENAGTAEVLLSNGLVYKIEDAFDVKNLIGVFCHG